MPLLNGAALARSGARVLRRFPAVERTAVRVVGRVRASTTIREIASRVFDFDVTAAGQAVFLSPGTLVAGRGVENLPVVVVSLIDVPPELVPDVVEEIAREQVLTAGFRPVLVLEQGPLAAARRFGYPVELLVERTAWSDEYLSWEEYATRRLTAIRRTYQAAAMVPATPAGLGTVGRAVLGSLR